jgi:3',5'-cyclic AMP phosphodiesterase CpdA
MNFLRCRALRLVSALFAITLAAAAAGFDFAILGDRTGGAVPGIYEKVVKEIAARHPAFVINVGDSIQGMDDVTTKDEWNAVRPIWKAFGDTPLYLIPGNHDIWSPASLRLWKSETGHPPHYSFDFRGAHITVLDNSRTGDLSEDELEFLDTDLAAHAARSPKLVFFHRPFWLLPIKFQNGDFDLHRIAKKHGVTWVICGHAHFFDRSTYDGIEYVIVGSSGGSLDHGGGNGTPFEGTNAYYGYGWMHVEGPTARLEFKRVNP